MFYSFTHPTERTVKKQYSNREESMQEINTNQNLIPLAQLTSSKNGNRTVGGGRV